MGHVADWRIAGWLPLQHHDPSLDVGSRLFAGAMRVHPTEEPGDEQPGRDTYGDVQGGLLWRSIEARRDHAHAWFVTGAPAVSVSGAAGPSDPARATRTRSAAETWLPARSADARPDDRFETKRPGHPGWWEGVFPTGWTGELGAATNEDAQEELLHPDFWGLIAVNRSGNPKAGTPVFDLDEDGRPARFARFQSLASVLDFPAPVADLPPGKKLALQLGRGGRIDGGSGHALWVDHDFEEVACGGLDQGGPFTAGRKKCQHALGLDGDGYAVHPMHFAAGSSSGAMWLAPWGADAPLMFSADPWITPDATPLPIWRRVHLRLNRELAHRHGAAAGNGMWEWEIDTAVYVPPPIGDRWPPPPQPPPPGDDPWPPKPPQPPPPVGDPGGDPGGTREHTRPPPPFIGTPPPAGGGKPRPPEGIEDTILDGGRYGGHVLVGGGGKPAYPHIPSCVALPNVIFKASGTRPGEETTSGSTSPSPEALRAFEDAPQTATLEGWAKGDGSADGFATYRPNDVAGWAMSAGGLLALPPDVSVAAYLEAVQRGEQVTTSAPMSFTLPPSLSKLAFADADRATGAERSGFVMQAPVGGASLTTRHKSTTGTTGAGVDLDDEGTLRSIASDGTTQQATLGGAGVTLPLYLEADAIAWAAAENQTLLYVDSVSGHVSRVDPDGNVVDLESGGAGSGSGGPVGFPNSVGDQDTASAPYTFEAGTTWGPWA